ncbi:hypothetical protein, partial [Rhizobium leguminosarum]|uniref:hypothetical protein n=1 Tax=Rhizobium leguminosarum TaxID=384 RepID=UPI001FDF9BBB
MIYSALIEKIGDDIEEEVSVLICEERLTCFASYMPYPVHVGEVYEVELVAVVLNEYFIEESNDELPSIFRTGTDYSYLLTGMLDEGNMVIPPPINGLQSRIFSGFMIEEILMKTSR